MAAESTVLHLLIEYAYHRDPLFRNGRWVYHYPKGLISFMRIVSVLICLTLLYGDLFEPSFKPVSTLAIIGNIISWSFAFAFIYISFMSNSRFEIDSTGTLFFYNGRGGESQFRYQEIKSIYRTKKITGLEVTTLDGKEYYYSRLMVGTKHFLRLIAENLEERKWYDIRELVYKALDKKT